MLEWITTADLFEVLMVGSVVWMAYILIYWKAYNDEVINDRQRTNKVKE